MPADCWNHVPSQFIFCFKKKLFFSSFSISLVNLGAVAGFFRGKEKRRRLGWLHFDEVRQSLERRASFHRHPKAKRWVYIHRKWTNQVESKQELKFNHRRRFWKKSLWKKCVDDNIDIQSQHHSTDRKSLDSNSRNLYDISRYSSPLSIVRRGI